MSDDDATGKFQIHRSCPHCDKTGTAVTGQDEVSVVCENPACRVFTFARYYP